MEIPGTQNLEVGQVNPGHINNELFCYCVRDLLGETYLDNFLQHISNFLPDFVFSKDIRDHLQEQYSSGKTLKTPLDKAREFLQRTQSGDASSSGEFAEFLLFLFAKEVKGAHKLVSKIQSRGSTNMTIPGRDCVFAYKDERGDIYMLLGEAKARPDSNDGLREAQTDMNNFWASGNIRHEVNLASTHLRTELTEENASLYEAYFIDDNPQHRNLKYKNVILVSYSIAALNGLIRGAISFTDFQAHVVSDLERCFRNQSSLIATSTQPTIYCFVPFENIDTARSKFANVNNTFR